MKRSKLKLGAQTLRHLTSAQLSGVAGAGRTGSTADCVIACTQSCDQCSLWPACPTETSTSTF